MANLSDYYLMRLLLTACLILLAFAAMAQKSMLSGKVTDKDTGEPLPFASIVIKGKPVGTVANLLGDFDFHFPVEYRNDILVVSMLGYESFEAPVWSLLNKGTLAVTLPKSATMLSEVVVTDSLAGGEILRIALGRIEQNFPMQPFMLDGFYRDVKKVGGTTVALLEAAVKIYDKDYAPPRNKAKLREHVKLIEIRKSLGYDNKFAMFFDQKNLLEDLLLHNSVRYHQDLPEEVLSDVERLDDTSFDGHDIYVVEYNKDFHLRAFIDQQDYAILHIDLEISYKGPQLEERKNLVNKFIGYKKKMDFRRYNGKMYLNYLTVVTNEHWHDYISGELKFETELVQHLLVNQVHAPATEVIKSTERMRNYGLQYQDYPYNKQFWDDYNVIKETPLDQQIVQDLEKNGSPLDKQFQEN